VLVAVIWGLNWVAAKLALEDLSPWSFRTLAFGFGAVILLIVAKRRRVSLRIDSGWPVFHIVISGLLNVGGFGILSAFSQIGTPSSRSTICAYTMPIWAALLARLTLRERLDRFRGAALFVGGLGLVVLLAPLTTVEAGLPAGVIFALGAAVSWAAGTIYLKWAKIAAQPLAIASWQLVVGTVAIAIGFVTCGVKPNGLHLVPAMALIYSTIFGSAVAYLLWFDSVSKLPASTAGLGTLLAPIIGVIASVAILGDRPSTTDLMGFALILVAAICALVAEPRVKPK
jgi:drug/metabolite transporter (DMT)-like permease